jgi:hypothetical protein
LAKAEMLKAEMLKPTKTKQKVESRNAAKAGSDA